MIPIRQKHFHKHISPAICPFYCRVIKLFEMPFRFIDALFFSEFQDICIWCISQILICFHMIVKFRRGESIGFILLVICNPGDCGIEKDFSDRERGRWIIMMIISFWSIPHFIEY